MKIKIFNKEVPIEIRGEGYPMLIVGPASLFKKPAMLPDELYEHFQVYFVDIFAASTKKTKDYSQVMLEDFIDAIETIRKALIIDKLILFAHSSNGVLALEYAHKYPSKVIFNILIGTMPIWGEYRKKCTSAFFSDNASVAKKELEKNDQVAFSKLTIFRSEMEKFTTQYKFRKAYYFSDENLKENSTKIEQLWDGIDLDMELVERYFFLIQSYDIRKTYRPVPTFLALGMYDSSCPEYAWIDDFKAWLSKNKKTNLFDTFIKYYIFDSDHYLMSPQFKSSKPKLLVDMLLEEMRPFMNSYRSRL